MMHIHKTEDTSDDGDDPDYHTLADLSTDSDIESEASSQESVPNIVNSSRSIWPIRSRSWQTKSKLSSSNASISKPMEHTELTVDNINADVASKVIRRFIVLQLAEEGFERAETAALERLQAEVVACQYGFLLLITNNIFTASYFILLSPPSPMNSRKSDILSGQGILGNCKSWKAVCTGSTCCCFRT